VSLLTKIVSSAALPVALVLGAAGVSMVALGDAGDASRRVLARLAPVVREAGAAHESLAALGRLHARWIATGEPAYEGAWATRMASLDRRLVGLGRALETPRERRRLLKAIDAVARYRELVATDQGLRRLGVAALGRANAASVRVRRAIDAIPLAVQETARRAESRAGIVALHAWNVMVAGGMLAGALALVLSSWVGRRVARGLDRLTDCAVALERGRLDQPVDIGGRDELGCLAVALEALAAGLGERDRVCEDTIRRLGRDVAEPLATIRDATRALASDLDTFPTHAQTLVMLIGDAAEDLMRQADRIGVDPTRPALDAPHVPALPAPRALPAVITLGEKRS
jgi:hypothetical protein